MSPVLLYLLLTKATIMSFEHPWQGKIAQTKGSAITMTNDDIQLLYEYDRWANNSVLQAVSTLSVEEFTRDLGGSFRSVRDTLVHIIGGEWGWLTIWKEPSLIEFRII